jgi:glycosyltransferase involved in cell wall biosynthesis
MFGSNVWGALLAPRVKVPVFVAHEHTWSFEGQPLRKLLDRHLIARRADAFVAVSREDQRRMVEIEGVPEAKTRFIPNGIPKPSTSEPSSDLRAELGIGADQPVIGVVAVMRPQKALDVLVRAAESIREQLPNLRVLVVGGGGGRGEERGTDYAQDIHSLAADLGLEETVDFLGPRDDVPDVLAALDVAVLSSDYEGSPISILEYMEAGKPVVATRVGGVPDLVEDGVTGVLVDRQDPEALAEAVVGLLRDPDRARSMGEAGRRRRREEFSIEASVRRVEALYEELCAARAGA